MNCKWTSQKLGSYLDGELSGSEMLLMRSHLNDCCACAEEAESLRSLKSALSSLPSLPTPEGLEDRLMKAVAQERSWLPAGHGRGVVWTSGLALAAAAGFALVWFGYVQRRPQVAPMASKEQPSFEVSRDQAYEAASDPLSGHSMVVTASYGGR